MSSNDGFTGVEARVLKYLQAEFCGMDLQIAVGLDLSTDDVRSVLDGLCNMGFAAKKPLREKLARQFQSYPNPFMYELVVTEEDRNRRVVYEI